MLGLVFASFFKFDTGWSLYLIFGLHHSQVVSIGAECVQDVLFVLHPRFKLLAAVVESVQTQSFLQTFRLWL